MKAPNLVALNKLWGGYSTGVVQWVSCAGAGRVSGEVFGDGRRFGADRRSMLAKTPEFGPVGQGGASCVARLAHFVLFQRLSCLALAIVASLSSHGWSMAKVFRALQGAGRLMGHYWTRDAFDRFAAGQCGAVSAQAEGGRPLSPAAHPLHLGRVHGEQDLEKKAKFERMSLGCILTFQGFRKRQISPMGSGVRDALRAHKLRRESVGFGQIKIQNQGSGKDHIGVRSLEAGEVMKLESAGCYVNQ
jgi:hypothetical protein